MRSLRRIEIDDIVLKKDSDNSISLVENRSKKMIVKCSGEKEGWVK